MNKKHICDNNNVEWAVVFIGADRIYKCTIRSRHDKREIVSATALDEPTAIELAFKAFVEKANCEPGPKSEKDAMAERIAKLEAVIAEMRGSKPEAETPQPRPTLGRKRRVLDEPPASEPEPEAVASVE